MIPDFCHSKFHATSTINPPKYASFTLPWGPRRFVGFWICSCPRVRFTCRCVEYPRLFDAIGWFTVEELVETVEFRFIPHVLWFCHNPVFFSSCILFAIVLEWLFKLKFWAQQKRAEMADVEQNEEDCSFVTCEITFGQNVCELTLGFGVSDLNFWCPS